MKKKIISCVLAFAMFSSILPTAMPAMAAEKESIVAETDAAKHLEEQLEKSNIHKGKVTVLVGLNDKWMEESKNLDAVPIEDRKDVSLIGKQADYAEKARKVFEKQVDALGIDMDVTQSYDLAFTGLAIETTVDDARKIAALPSVEDVELSIKFKAPSLEKVKEQYKKMDETSNQMIHAEKAWNSQYTGKGQLVAIIDSGFDYKHPAFQKIDSTGLKYADEASINKVIREKDLSPGKFLSEKVPFAYNYVNKNTNVKEISAHSHGMHVAGIVAANGDKLKGVVPDAQLAIMRVFGDSIFGGGTSSEIYNKAIDDAIKLGCDSINMSLGAPAGSEDDVDIQETMALENAKEMGIVIAIAAGNDGFSGNGVVKNPNADNPDYGIVSAPGVAPLSMAVASIENLKIARKGMRVKSDSDKIINYVPSSVGTLTKEYVSIANCGYGYEDEMKKASDNNTYALMQRGQRPGDPYKTFADKVNIADKFGYQGVIVYDNEPNSTLFVMETPGAKLPAALISKTDGEYLLKHLDTQVTFSDEYIFTENTEGNELSSFSSWGVSPEGNLKPDITAPGGNIFSTLNDGTYGNMSGTSMASPHVAGGLAVAKQRVEKDFPNIQGEKKYQLVKNLLMSAATPHVNKTTNAYTSPRKQGAGVMNLDAAIATSVVFEGTHEVSSVNLGNVKENTITVPFKLHNYGNQELSYTVQGVLNTDTVKDGKVLLTPRELTKSEEQVINVPANESVSVEVKMTIPENLDLEKEMKNGFFVEGFIFAKAAGQLDISMPYVGFKGNFQSLNVIEPSIYDLLAENKRPYYYEKTEKGGIYYTHLGAVVNNEAVVLGKEMDSTYENPKYTKEHIAFSPNGDGNADTAIFFGTFLRNYKAFAMAVLDKDGQVVDSFNVPHDKGKKSYFMNPDFYNVPYANLMQTKKHWQWSGSTLQGKTVEDGKYTLQVKAWGKGKDEKEQTIDFPLIVDRVYPRVEKAHFENDKKKYVIEKIDEKDSGIHSVYIVEGKNTIKPAKENDGKYVFDLNGVKLDEATLVVNDYAFNKLEIPMKSAERTGKEQSIRVVGRTSSGAVPSGAYQWTVQSEDGRLEDAYNLKPGKHILVINDVVDATYKLTGNKKIPFEIKSGELVTEVVVPFETVAVRPFTVVASGKTDTNVSFSVIDTITKRQFQLIKKNGGIYEAEVPVGTYKITVNGVEGDGYVMFVSGDTKEVSLNTHFRPVEVRIGTKEPQKVTLNIARNGYTGPLTVQFVGQDSEKTEQTVKINAGKDSIEHTLLTIPSDIHVQGLEDSYYTVKAGSSWNGFKNKATISLVKKKYVNPGFVNKAELRKVVEEVDQIVDQLEELYEYDRVTFQYIKIYLNTAHSVLNDEGATQTVVDGVVRNMREALATLVKKGESGVKTAAIQALIEQAEGLSEKDYTAETWKKLHTAFTKAKKVVKESDVVKKQDVIDSAAEDLQDALNALKRVDGKALIDKSKLQESIEKAKSLHVDDYTPESWVLFEAALEDAQKLDENTFPSEKSMTKAIKNLELAIKELKKAGESAEPEVVDKDALQALVDDVKKLEETHYTAESWKHLQDVLQQAEAVLKNEAATTEAVENILKDLKVAQKSLKKVENTTPAEDKVKKRVERFNKAVRDLPYPEEVVKADRTQIEVTRAYYDVLPERGKDMIKESTLERLEKAENALDRAYKKKR